MFRLLSFFLVISLTQLALPAQNINLTTADQDKVKALAFFAKAHQQQELFDQARRMGDLEKLANIVIDLDPQITKIINRLKYQKNVEPLWLKPFSKKQRVFTYMDTLNKQKQMTRELALISLEIICSCQIQIYLAIGEDMADGKVFYR